VNAYNVGGTAEINKVCRTVKMKEHGNKDRRNKKHGYSRNTVK
jgi:hypothetical protein